MKILQINTVYAWGSTGKIAKQLQETCKINGIDCYVAYRYAEKKSSQNDTITISSYLDCHIHNRLARWTMLQGCFSYFKTKRFLKKIDKLKVDVIHLHNLHGSYINHSLLFKYIKKNKMKVVWTLHDCWSFTGNCAYFDFVGCEKWKTGCGRCPIHKESHKAFMDATNAMWKKKKQWFTGVQNMTLITPSQWLADLTKQSFLKDYPVQVIHNGIDLNIFRPTESNFREKYHCENKFIVLGVAFDWGKRKGLDIFIELAQHLDERFQIVLVGTDENIDRVLPANIISIHRTQSQKGLAEIYTAADVFVNPTREDNYPTVNMESLACGTPVITFDTGGSPEIIDEHCGIVVEKDNVLMLKDKIEKVCNGECCNMASCLDKAKSFDMNIRFNEYIELYHQV